jgi:L-ascorbate metabolism protein UlaG (beta-lactamase superfamily)
LSAPDAAAGADALLITHEHADHYEPARIKTAISNRPRLPIWTNKSVAGLLDGSGADVHVIGDGDVFDAGGIPLHCYGEWHAPLHPEIPLVRNTGFLVDGRIFHPGDALTDPRVPIKLLLAPVQEFFARADQLVYYIRQLKPEQVSPVHDGTLNALGQQVIEHFLAEQATHTNAAAGLGSAAGTGAPYTRLAADTPVFV